jgi:leader peptidase (prepilin peptidase)/N-methyltransferase
MVPELAFLAPCLGLGLLGWYVGRWLFSPQQSPPLWLAVLGGVLMGYLIGGGVVWAVRVLGSLAFGKEAMGLGDVHLMAGVGACLGWIDATIAFFLAAFVALFLTLGTAIVMGGARRTLPFGPSLAIASVLVLVGKPAVEWGLSQLLHQPVNLP